MTPEQLVACIDFRYISDAITPNEAIEILRQNEPGRDERIARLQEEGYPAYTTSAGWIGYSDAQIQELCREALDHGWSHFKITPPIMICKPSTQYAYLNITFNINIFCDIDKYTITNTIFKIDIMIGMPTFISKTN